MKRKGLAYYKSFVIKKFFIVFFVQTHLVLRSICFSLSEISLHVFTNNAGHLVKHAVLEDYVKDKVPSLKQFFSKGNVDQESNIPSLEALSSAMRLIIGC
jgi:amidase